MSANEILDRLGLDGPYDQLTYVRTVERRFGRHGVRYLDAIDRALAEESPALWERAYALLNKVPELSHYVTAHANPHLYRAMLDLLVGCVQRTPVSVLELGCGNGLFTCCLALLWPSAKVVGIDVAAGAIRTARVLAARLEVPGVAFEKGDLTGPAVRELGRNELLVAPFLFHHFLDAGPERWAMVRTNIGSWLEPEGSLISIDRFPHSVEQRQLLIQHLAPLGLQSVVAETMRVGQEAFPVTVFM